ncbi:MAG TPA: DUF2510 domain-containing protein [Ilumatobacter sp.]|nr:DUF2510 domain-containing protein [Ilumatobacter sp.]
MLEFDSISVSTYEAASLAPQLTERSAAGWQVVSIVSAGSSVTAYLSRAAQDAPDDDAADSIAAVPAEPTFEVIEEPVVEIVDVTPAEEPAVDAPAEVQVDEVQIDEIQVDEVPAAETAAEIPLLPSEPDQAWQPEAATSAPEVPSLADDVAALASQIEDEPDTSVPTDEPGGWASTATETTAEPTLPGSVPAAEQVAEPVAEAVAEPVQQAAAANAAPAGWYADPSSRFELRYWDGAQWTEHVSRAGQQYTDPPVA